MSLLTQLRAKQKRDAELAAERRAKRIAKKVARTTTPSGLDDLPIEVAVALEDAASTPPPETATVDVAPNSSEDLVARLTKVRERLFWLQAVWATSLSPDVYQEAEQYRRVFQALGEQLKKQDPDTFGRLVAGHEALLLAEPMPTKGTLPLATQRWFELVGELQSRPTPRPEPKPAGYVADGLQSLL
jgi:hypothetical protein